MKTIRHTGIVVKDLAGALRFYRDLLGLKLAKQMKESGSYIDTICGIKDIEVTTVKLSAEDGNLIELLYYHSHLVKAGKEEKICTVGLSHIAFTVEDIDAEYKRLRDAGVKFNSPPQISPDKYAKVAFCRDFEENLVELVEVL